MNQPRRLSFNRRKPNPRWRPSWMSSKLIIDRNLPLVTPNKPQKNQKNRPRCLSSNRWKPNPRWQPYHMSGFLGKENHSCDISTQKTHSCDFLIVSWGLRGPVLKSDKRACIDMWVTPSLILNQALNLRCFWDPPNVSVLENRLFIPCWKRHNIIRWEKQKD
jgi:hypothetical protein